MTPIFFNLGHPEARFHVRRCSKSRNSEKRATFRWFNRLQTFRLCSSKQLLNQNKMLKLTVHICLVKVSVGSSRCFKSSSWITFHYLVALILFIVLSGSFFVDVRITCCGDDCMWWLFNKYLFKYLQMLAAYCDLQWIAAIVGQYRINFFWLFLIYLYYDLNQYNWFILWFKSISVVMRHSMLSCMK